MKNTVQLIGNMGIDPEVINYQSGTRKVRFTLATKERYIAKDGSLQTRTIWHTIYAWGAAAAYVAKSARKGTQVALTGRLKTRQYVSKTGESRKFTSIEAQNIVALS